MTINFLNLAPVFDTVPGPLTVTGTNGNDAITYSAPANPADQGLVSVNNQESIEFANKTSLTINTLNGTDAVSINNTTAQTGLTGITVNGGDPSAGDTLTVSGTTGADTVNYSPTGVGAGMVAVGTLPTVTFAGIGSVAYDGGGGNDALTVTTPASSTATGITFTPGATANEGSISLRQGSNAGAGATNLPPLSYTNVDRDGTLTFATARTGGTRGDTLTYNGVGSGDTFVIGGNATGDQVQLGTPGNFAGALDVTASGVSGLVVQGVGSNDAFLVTAPLAFSVPEILNSGVTLLGGGPGASVSITGDGSGQLTIVPQFGDSLPLLTGDGLGNGGVSLGSIASTFVDANSQGVLFSGTSTADEADYTPIGADEGLVTFPGADTQFDVNGLGTNPLLFDEFGSGNLFKVIGSSDPTTFNVSQSGANTVVAVTDVTTGIALLPANIVSADTGSLFVQGGAGNNTLTVDSTAAAVAIPITYDGGGGQNTLTLSGGTATSDTYAPGPAAGSGTSQIVLGGVTQTVSFMNLAPVFDTVAGPLTVSGTNGNDAIAYSAPANPADQGLVSVNDQESIEFANKTGLTINTLNGTDAVSINNTTAQTGLTGITVNGGDPGAGDTLTVSGTTGADTVNYSPTGVGAGTVAVDALPTVTFAGIGSVAYNGDGGNDALTVTTPGTPTSSPPAAALPLTDITFTPGATANQGSISLRQGSAAGVGATLLPSLSYTNIDINGTLTFATARTGGTRNDTLIYNGVGSGDTFTIGGNATDDQILLDRPGGFAGALDVTASSVSALVVQGVGSNDAFNITAPIAFSVPEILNGGVTLLGGGPDASVAITGDGSGQLTIVPQLGDSLPLLTGDGLGNKGVSLGSIASAFVNAKSQGVLFSGTSTGGEADYTPVGSDEGLVAFPGADTQYDVTGFGGNPLLFDEARRGQPVQGQIGSSDPNAFNVSRRRGPTPSWRSAT